MDVIDDVDMPQAEEDIVESDLNLYYEVVHHDSPQKVNPS
jgi:hypothetical protein